MKRSRNASASNVYAAETKEETHSFEIHKRKSEASDNGHRRPKAMKLEEHDDDDEAVKSERDDDEDKAVTSSAAKLERDDDARSRESAAGAAARARACPQHGERREGEGAAAQTQKGDR